MKKLHFPIKRFLKISATLLIAVLLLFIIAASRVQNALQTYQIWYTNMLANQIVFKNICSGEQKSPHLCEKNFFDLYDDCVSFLIAEEKDKACFATVEKQFNEIFQPELKIKNVKSADVIIWASRAIKEALSYDNKKEIDHFIKIKNDFTYGGFVFFAATKGNPDERLINSKESLLYDNVRENFTGVVFTPSQSVKIISEGEINSLYTWYISIPGTLTYKGKNREQDIAEEVEWILVVEQTYSNKNPNHLGIRQIQLKTEKEE